MKETWPAAVEVLAKGGTKRDAARAADVTEQTVLRWLRDEVMFADAVEDARSVMIDAATGTLAASTVAMAETLASLAVDVTVAPQYRIAAARAGLELAAKYRNDTAIESRLRALEVAAGIRAEAPA